VNVNVIVFPISEADAVYVNVKGEDVIVAGLTEPPPFAVIVTCVALPPNLFADTVTGVAPHAVPVVDDRLMEGPFTQPHSTANSFPVVVHPALFLTVTL
jgi:hypothetical protein